MWLTLVYACLCVHPLCCGQLWNGRKDNFLDPLHVIPAHREPCRSISIAPTDRKFVSASDDSTIKVSLAFQPGYVPAQTKHLA